MWTQGVAVLAAHVPQLPILRVSLESQHEVLRATEDAVTLAYRPEVGGVIVVDVVPQRWPDEALLQRAAEQAWSWGGDRAVVAMHRAHVRIRLTYAGDHRHDAPVELPSRDPVDELRQLTAVAATVLAGGGGISLLNPAGEVMLVLPFLQQTLAWARQTGVPELQLWTNVRHHSIDERWQLLDTVGHGQLDLPDLEIVYPGEAYSREEIDPFLRTLSLQLLQRGRGVVDDGERLDGPGGAWLVTVRPESLAEPARDVLRLTPVFADAPEGRSG